MKIRNIGDVGMALTEIADLGDTWYKDICGPTGDVLREVSRVFDKLWDEYKIFPSRVSQTVKEGIYVEFQTSDSRKIILEICNNGDATMLINKDSFDIPKRDRVNIICKTLVKILENY